MNNKPGYYWRRACEEIAGAASAVTPAARSRREQLVWVFIERLKEMGAARPFTDEEIVEKFAKGDTLPRELAFSWKHQSRAVQKGVRSANQFFLENPFQRQRALTPRPS